MDKILVASAEESIHKIVKHSLSNDEYSIIYVFNGTEALEIFNSHKPDLIILDIILPKLDGIELCRQIKKNIDIPVLFIASKDTSHDIAMAFGAGGDDYIKKPFNPIEIVLRVKMHLRRRRMVSIEPEDKNILEFPNMKINLTGRTVKICGLPIELTAKEFDLLVFLAKKPNHFFSREQLIACLWKHSDSIDNRSLMVHICNLRKKIEDNPAKPQYIVSSRGVGYKFNKQSQSAIMLNR